MRWASRVIVAGATPARRACSRAVRSATSAGWSITQRAASCNCGGRPSNPDFSKPTSAASPMIDLYRVAAVPATNVSQEANPIGMFQRRRWGLCPGLQARMPLRPGKESSSPVWAFPQKFRHLRLRLELREIRLARQMRLVARGVDHAQEAERLVGGDAELVPGPG